MGSKYDLTWENAQALKELLISSEVDNKMKAVTYINSYLKVYPDNPNFIVTILESHMIDFLLELLLSLDCKIKSEVLFCLKHLCTQEVFYKDKYPDETIKIVLRSMDFLINEKGNDFILAISLAIINDILYRHSLYLSNCIINTEMILVKLSDLITARPNSTVTFLCAKVYNSIIRNSCLRCNLSDGVLVKIECTFLTFVSRAVNLAKLDQKATVKALFSTCKGTYELLKETHKKTDELYKLNNKLANVSLNRIESFCTEYVSALDIHINNLSIVEKYVDFIATLFSMNLTNTEKLCLSRRLLYNRIFYILMRYMEVYDLSSNEKFRTQSITILSEIISQTEGRDGNDDYIMLLKCRLIEILMKIPTSLTDWFAILQNKSIMNEDKLYVVVVLCYSYIFSDNVKSLTPNHLTCIISFVIDITSRKTLMLEFMLRCLWLIFAVLTTSQRRRSSIPGLQYAVNKFHFFLLRYNDFEYITPYHSSILSWIFIFKNISETLQTRVLEQWVLKASLDVTFYIPLTKIVSIHRKAGYVLMNILLKSESEFSISAMELLRRLFAQKVFKPGDRIFEILPLSIPPVVNEFFGAQLMDKVISIMNLIKLNHEALQCTPYSETIEFSVYSIIHLVESIGITPNIPAAFYATIFEYTNRVLQENFKHNLKGVFTKLSASDKFLYVIIQAIMSRNGSLISSANKFLAIIYQYQIKYINTCQKQWDVNNEVLIELLCLPDTEDLKLSLILLNNMLSVLNRKDNTLVIRMFRETEHSFIQALYLRCITLLLKPECECLSKIVYKCLSGILSYTAYHPSNLKLHVFLCNHPGNHNIITCYFDKITRNFRYVDRSFLKFITTLLTILKKHCSEMMIKNSMHAIFWKRSLNYLAIELVKMRKKSNVQNLFGINSVVIKILSFRDVLPTTTTAMLQDAFTL